MKALTKTSHEHRARPADYSVYVRAPSAWDRVRAGLVLSLSAVAGFWIVRLVVWWVGIQAGR